MASANTRATMKAAVCRPNPDGTSSLSVEDVAIPEPGEGEALVKVIKAGICSTDEQLLRGYMGFSGTLGHEFVGIVERANSAPELVGSRVCGDINLACDDDSGACSVCALRRPLASGEGDVGAAGLLQLRRNHCPRRTVLGILAKDGCFAEYVTLPTRNLHVVPDNVADSEAVFAEPLAAALRIAEQGLLEDAPDATSRRPLRRVAVLGDGKLGLLCAAASVGHMRLRRRASSPGADSLSPSSSPSPLQEVCIVGRHAAKMNLLEGIAGESDGVTLRHVVVARRDAGAPPGLASACDVVVDATGHPDGLSTALAMLAPMGTLVLKVPSSACPIPPHPPTLARTQTHVASI